MDRVQCTFLVNLVRCLRSRQPLSIRHPASLNGSPSSASHRRSRKRLYPKNGKVQLIRYKEYACRDRLLRNVTFTLRKG